jgi:hypothetical protein
MEAVLWLRPLIAEARSRSQTSQCQICGEKSGIVTGFSPRTSVSLSISFHLCSTFIAIYTLLLLEGQTGEAWDPFRKRQCYFANRRTVDRKLILVSEIR